MNVPYTGICLFVTDVNIVLVPDLSSYDINQGPNFIYEPPSLLRFSNSTGNKTVKFRVIPGLFTYHIVNIGHSLPCSAHGIPPPHISWVTQLGHPIDTVPGLRYQH